MLMGFLGCLGAESSLGHSKALSQLNPEGRRGCSETLSGVQGTWQGGAGPLGCTLAQLLSTGITMELGKCESCRTGP